jgi:hypothetical protein
MIQIPTFSIAGIFHNLFGSSDTPPPSSESTPTAGNAASPPADYAASAATRPSSTSSIPYYPAPVYLGLRQLTNNDYIRSEQELLPPYVHPPAYSIDIEAATLEPGRAPVRRRYRWSLFPFSQPLNSSTSMLTSSTHRARISSLLVAWYTHGFSHPYDGG